MTGLANSYQFTRLTREVDNFIAFFSGTREYDHYYQDQAHQRYMAFLVHTAILLCY